MGECLSRTIEIYRRDALQSDGKSDGENVASSRREKFTVKRIPKLTANSGRKVQHPCGFPVDRRIGPADGRSACCQAIGRTVRSVSWRRAAQGKPLRDRRSTRGSRQRPTLATFHSRVVRSPRPLGIECPQCVGQPPHGRAPWRAAPGQERSIRSDRYAATCRHRNVRHHLLVRPNVAASSCRASRAPQPYGFHLAEQSIYQRMVHVHIPHRLGTASQTPARGLPGPMVVAWLGCQFQKAATASAPQAGQGEPMTNRSQRPPRM